MRDLGLGWITSPEICDHEHACVCVDVRSMPSRPGQARGERTRQVCMPTLHRLTCPAWCPCPQRVWRPGQRQDFALRPQHSRLGTVRVLWGPRARAGRPCGRLDVPAAHGAQGPPPPASEGGKHSCGLQWDPGSEPSQIAFSADPLRPCRVPGPHGGFALPRAPGPRISPG